MLRLLLATLLVSTPVLATSNEALDHINGAELCAAVEYELEQAVDFDIITSTEANDILLRCYVNYS